MTLISPIGIFLSLKFLYRKEINGHNNVVC